MTFYLILPIVGVILWCDVISLVYGQTTTLPTTDTNIWQALASVLTGVFLASGSLFFFIKRIIKQYDDRHTQHEEEIASMQKKILEIDTTLKKNLEESTEIIMDSLNGLKDSVREIITDVAILKDDRKRCFNLNDRLDNNTGSLKVLEVQFESVTKALSKLEKQIEKMNKP